MAELAIPWRVHGYIGTCLPALHRTHGMAPASPALYTRLLVSTIGNSFHVLCQWRCLLPKGVVNCSVIMAFIAAKRWSMPICRCRRFTETIQQRSVHYCTLPSPRPPAVSAAAIRSAVVRVDDAHVFIQAQPCHTCLVGPCTRQSRTQAVRQSVSQSSASHTYHCHGWDALFLSAAVAPDWSSGAPLTQHAPGRASPETARQTDSQSVPSPASQASPASQLVILLSTTHVSDSLGIFCPMLQAAQLLGVSHLCPVLHWPEMRCLAARIINVVRPRVACSCTA